MGWTCRRPGCHREAAVAIAYDPVACQVWLDPLHAPASQMLCLDHAERLHPPRGWVVVDRRDAQSVIVAPRAGGLPTAAARARRPARSWGQLDEPRLEFTPAPPAAETPEPPAAEAEPAPEPVAERVDDLEPLFRPKGRLLARAFESVGEQRSALTQIPPD